MNDTSALDVYCFLRQLGERKIPYRLSSIRDNAILVEVTVPGEHWEVEFFATGEVEIEVFRSDGNVRDIEALDELFERWSE